MLVISGNTFPHRNTLRSLNAEWHAPSKTWRAEAPRNGDLARMAERLGLRVTVVSAEMNVPTPVVDAPTPPQRPARGSEGPPLLAQRFASPLRSEQRALVGRLEGEYGTGAAGPRPVPVPTEASRPVVAPAPERTWMERATERVQPRPVVVPEPVRRPRLTRADAVAGARVEAEGVLLGWSGAGELTLGAITECLTEAGLPVSWAPSAKSPRAQAGAVCESLAGSGYVVRAERARDRSGGRRDYTARWFIGAVGGLGGSLLMPGSEYGSVAIVVTLRDEALTTEALPQHRVRADELVAEYRRRLAAEAFTAGEVTDWLRDTLRERCRAVRFGGVWYVHRSNARDAEALCDALSHRWGNDWMLPALPVASGEALERGLAKGLHTEASAILRAWMEQRDAARSEGRTVGARAAASTLAKLQETADRVREYGALLGPELDGLRIRLAEALEQVRPYLDDTAQRGAMLDLD